MRIENFKNALVGGGARANLYRVNGTFPAAAVAAAGLNPSQAIQFLATGAEIPAVDITPVPVAFQGRILKLAGDRSFPEITLKILNDNNFALRNAFEKWSDVINRVETNISRNSLSEYAQQWTITHLDRTGKDIKIYKFVDLWVSNISNIQLTYEQQNTIETFDVTLQYQYYTMQGTTS